jgi:hypothetical protein
VRLTAPRQELREHRLQPPGERRIDVLELGRIRGGPVGERPAQLRPVEGADERVDAVALGDGEQRYPARGA